MFHRQIIFKLFLLTQLRQECIIVLFFYLRKLTKYADMSDDDVKKFSTQAIAKDAKPKLHGKPMDVEINLEDEVEKPEPEEELLL